MRFDRPFHASDIRRYLQCPRQFYLHEFLVVPPEKRTVKMVNGAVMHCAIKNLHENWDADPRELYLAALQWQEELSPEKDIPIAWEDRETEIQELADNAAKILDNYAAKEWNRNCEVLLAEATFQVEVDGYKLEGKIDQLRRMNYEQYKSDFWLVDFKTGDTRPNQQFLDLDYQLSIYAYALWNGIFKQGERTIVPKYLPDRVVWYATQDHLPYKKKTTRNNVVYMPGQERGPAVYVTSRTEKEMVAFERDIKRVCGAIRMGTFPRNPSQLTCSMCRYWDACRADRDEGSLSYSERKRLTIALEEEE